MSYDLMVFDPASPPWARSEFMQWYKQQGQWAEAHSYNDPEVCTPELRAGFMEMIQAYPPMHGPYASDDVDNLRVTDYSVGRSVIYAGFSWSEAEGAFNAMFNLAEKHRVGLFDVSGTQGDVWMPTPVGEYVGVHGGEP